MVFVKNPMQFLKNKIQPITTLTIFQNVSAIKISKNHSEPCSYSHNYNDKYGNKQYLFM